MAYDSRRNSQKHSDLVSVTFTITEKARRKDESFAMTCCSTAFDMRETFGSDMIITCNPEQFAAFVCIPGAFELISDMTISVSVPRRPQYINVSGR